MSESEKSDLLFDLTLTDEQQMVRDSIRRFVEAELAPIAREADEAGCAPEGFYDRTVQLGLVQAVIPESLGGAGMTRSPVSNVLNAEDLARGDMSLAMGALTPLAFTNVLLDQGSAEQIETCLSGLAGERFQPASVALMEPRASFDASHLQTTAEKRGDQFVINGVKTMVPLAGEAKHLLVIADVDGEGPQGFVIESGQEGLSLTEEEHMGLRPLSLSRLTLENVHVSETARLGGSDGQLDIERLLDLGRLGLCAASLGVCQAILDYVIPYCNERVAFDEPITNRQSVAFMIGDMATELEAMRLMVYRAASLAERGLDFHRQTYLTRIQCARYAMQAGTNGVQLLGGHGFIREHPLEMWYRNLRAVAVLEGTVII